MTRPDRPASSLALATTSAAPSARRPDPPAHLSDDASAWWRDVVRDFDLEGHHLRLLQSAAEAWDRQQQARQALADHGSLTYVRANGDLGTHPAIAVERDARLAVARLIRELDLDASAPSERSRPPGLASNRR